MKSILSTTRRARHGSTRLLAILAAALLGACAGADEQGVEDGDDEATESSEVGVTCEPTMSVFPVSGLHNIGYDHASCGSGTCVTSCPDQNANSDWGGDHHGIDVFAWYRAPLVAVAAGTIAAVGSVSPTSGLRVRVRDACGWEYYYGHLDEAVVAQDQPVQAGQLIGYMGNTGTHSVHLHFNVSPNGGYSNDINPTDLLVATSATACSPDDGCTLEQRSACGAYGCACVDGGCSGGACDGSGCTAQKESDCAAYGCGCVDGECSGGACEGTGCTWKDANDCAAGGCGCVDGGCSGGACEGSGCTWRRENDCGAYGCGCVNMECSGGACP